MEDDFSFWSGKKKDDFRQGNMADYSQIYAAYYSKLCRYVYSMSNNTSIAEDIVQETLIGLWEKRNTLIISTSLNAYLYRSVRNRFLDYIRKEKRKSSLVEKLRQEAVLEVEEIDLELWERRLSAIETIVETLPEKRKKIFKLHKYQNYKYREIAEMQGVSQKTVESQIRKALITIREKTEGLKDSDKLALLVLLGPFL